MTRQVFLKAMVTVVAVFGLLVFPNVLAAQGNSNFDRVKSVQEAHTDALMDRPGVVGTAIGLGQGGQLVVLVLLERPGVAGIPAALNGVPVQVVLTGEIIALSHATGRFARPVPIGVSTGHPDITAGTIACRVKDDNGNVYALSNNHVYAAENDASIDDKVIQPGTYDLGSLPDDSIGTLADFEPIVFGRRFKNTIDAAIVLSSTADLGTATPGGYGTPNSTIVGAVLGQLVLKFGRTTELTTGVVTGVNATVNVRYSSGIAKFVKQIIIEPGGFSAGGDSGSLIVTDDDNLNPVGLLFAGSSTITVANRIDLVLAAFDVTVDSGAGTEPPPLNITTTSLPGGTMDQFYSATVEATDGTISYSWAITVGDLPNGLSLNSGTGEISGTPTTEETQTFEVTVTDSAAATDTQELSIAVNTAPTLGITTTSLPDGTVDQAYLATVEATDGTISYSWAITVGDLPNGLSLNSGTGEISGTPTTEETQTFEVTVTDSAAATDTQELSIAVNTAPTEPTTVSVASINYATEGGKNKDKHLLITIALVDDLGDPVGGASVTITLSLDGDPVGSATATTGTDGKVTFTLKNAESGCYTTIVTDVTTAAGLNWDFNDPANESGDFCK